MHQKETSIKGRKIAYYESAGKGQPVLFIHGNSMSGRCFERQFASPLAERHRLIAMDLPGHGRSAPAHDPESGYTLPGYADILCAFAEHLDLKNTVLVGWSLGGHVALEAIGRLQRPAGLIIFGTPPIGIPMAADAFLPNPLMALAFKNALSNEEIAAWTSSFFKPGTGIPEFFFKDMQGADGRARDTLGRSVGQGNYADEVKILSGLARPLAILHGEGDPLVNLSYLNGLPLPLLWRNEVQVVPDASHTPQWEQPDRFNSLLERFIADCGR